MDQTTWWASRAPQRVTVRVSGELDLDTGPRLRDDLAGELAQLRGTSATLVLDLSGVSFCDSSGLQTLIATLRRAKLLSRTLVLVVAEDSRLMRFLDLAGVRDLFSIVEPGPDDAQPDPVTVTKH